MNAACAVLVLLAGLASAPDPQALPAADPGVPSARDPESLEAEILRLKDDRVAWRQISWRTCLLDGLRESRRTGRPALVWVFFNGDPTTGRC